MFVETCQMSFVWCQDDNNYAAQLAQLDDVYHWKSDLRTFAIKHPTFSELLELQALPLDKHGPQETVNLINKHFICILQSVVKHELCIDEAWLRMILIIDFINRNMSNVP